MGQSHRRAERQQGCRSRPLTSLEGSREDSLRQSHQHLAGTAEPWSLPHAHLSWSLPHAHLSFSVLSANTPTILTGGNDPTQLKTRSQANQQCNSGHFLKGNLIRTREKHKSGSVRTTPAHQSARLVSAFNYVIIKPPTLMKSTPKAASGHHCKAMCATANVFLHPSKCSYPDRVKCDAA